MSASVVVESRTVLVEVSGQAPRTVEIEKPQEVIVEVTGGRGPQGPAASGGGGVSFLADPGPSVAAGESVLWIRPSAGSFSLIVREG